MLAKNTVRAPAPAGMMAADNADIIDEKRGTAGLVEQGVYSVETIVGMRVKRGAVEYYIKWLGWADSTNTWEPAENLEQADIDEFEAEMRREGKLTKRRKRDAKRRKRHLAPPARTPAFVDRARRSPMASATLCGSSAWRTPPRRSTTSGSRPLLCCAARRRRAACAAC